MKYVSAALPQSTAIFSTRSETKSPRRHAPSIAIIASEATSIMFRNSLLRSCCRVGRSSLRSVAASIRDIDVARSHRSILRIDVLHQIHEVVVDLRPAFAHAVGVEGAVHALGLVTVTATATVGDDHH